MIMCRVLWSIQSETVEAGPVADTDEEHNRYSIIHLNISRGKMKCIFEVFREAGIFRNVDRVWRIIAEFIFLANIRTPIFDPFGVQVCAAH